MGAVNANYHENLPLYNLRKTHFLLAIVKYDDWGCNFIDIVKYFRANHSKFEIDSHLMSAKALCDNLRTLLMPLYVICKEGVYILTPKGEEWLIEHNLVIEQDWRPSEMIPEDYYA